MTSYSYFLQLFDDFALLRPTIVASTPRLWNLLYHQYLKALHEAYTHHQSQSSPEQPNPQEVPAPPQSCAATAVVDDGSFQHFDPAQVPAELKNEVMAKFKSKLGGRERMITTGGAPTDKAVKKFIISCFSGMVNDGYGSTEVMAQV